MRAENTIAKQRWTSKDKELLIRLRDEAKDEGKSQTFFEKLTAAFNESSGTIRTVPSIADECRRLSLPVKRNPKTENCTEDICKIVLTKDNRVGNTCRRCYNRLWFRKNKSK